MVLVVPGPSNLCLVCRGACKATSQLLGPDRKPALSQVILHVLEPGPRPVLKEVESTNFSGEEQIEPVTKTVLKYVPSSHLSSR